MLIHSKAYGEAERWSDRWLTLSGNRNRDAVWHRMIIEQRQEKFFELLKRCNDALEIFSDDKAIRDLQSKIKEKVQQEMESSEGSRDRGEILLKPGRPVTLDKVLSFTKTAR